MQVLFGECCTEQGTDKSVVSGWLNSMVCTKEIKEDVRVEEANSDSGLLKKTPLMQATAGRCKVCCTPG
jgi:hypothetical protein